MSMDNNLWMGGIQPWMDEIFIMQAFNKYNFFPAGIKLIHDKITKELKNYCFVNFKTIEEANKCLIFLTGKTIPNTQIKFRLNWANYFSTFNKSVYVGNLSPDVDDISLYKLFKEKYPSVHHASVITDKGISKGFGFILFRGEEDYEKCLKEMNGTLFHGNIIKVNEQKKNNKNNNNESFTYGSNNDIENDNEVFNYGGENENMDVVYNYGGNNNNNYNIINGNNSNIDYLLQNKIINGSINPNNNNIIDLINLNPGYRNNNNRGSQVNKNIISLTKDNINQQMQNGYYNQMQLSDINNMNNKNIIHNIININNINKIHNINYINDNNINKIYNLNQNTSQNNNQINKNVINSLDNFNSNASDIRNRAPIININSLGQSQLINDINLNKNDNIINNKDLYQNEIIKEKSPILILNNINQKNSSKTDIMSKINSILLNNKKNKKGKKAKYNLEVLQNYENKTFFKLVEKKLDMMYKYYMEKYPYELNRFILSNMFIYYCQNEKQLNYFTNIF